MDVRDTNGTVLAEGDSVKLIKDLNVRGSSNMLKRGTLVKNIRLTADAEEIEDRNGAQNDVFAKSLTVRHQSVGTRSPRRSAFTKLCARRVGSGIRYPPFVCSVSEIAVSKSIK